MIRRLLGTNFRTEQGTGPDLERMLNVAQHHPSYKGCARYSDHNQQWMLNHLLVGHIGFPHCVFLGYFDDSTDQLLTFTMFNRMPRQFNYTIGETWGDRSHTAELWDYAIDTFRKEHMTTVWHAVPNKQIVDVNDSQLFNPTKFSYETHEVIPSKKTMADPFLHQYVMHNWSVSNEIAVLKFTDLNPIPWPDFNKKVDMPDPATLMAQSKVE